MQELDLHGKVYCINTSAIIHLFIDLKIFLMWLNTFKQGNGRLGSSPSLREVNGITADVFCMLHLLRGVCDVLSIKGDFSRLVTSALIWVFILPLLYVLPSCSKFTLHTHPCLI
jgi:hypothetical protein